jgi:hypothetical protein
MSHGISWGTATSVILIDADNTSPRVAAGLFEEPAKLSGPADALLLSAAHELEERFGIHATLQVETGADAEVCRPPAEVV